MAGLRELLFSWDLSERVTWRVAVQCKDSELRFVKVQINNPFE